MTSAEILAAQILGKQTAQAQRVVRGIVAGRPTAAQQHALELLETAEVPGSRNILPNQDQIWGTAADLIDQPEYRGVGRPGGQLRRPQQVQGTTPARGVNHWGAVDQRQLGGVRPEAST